MVRGRRILGQKFRREYPVPPYTVDFVCLELMLVIEVDGKDHLTDEGQLHDEDRDRFLRDQGFIVHRIPGYRVLQDAMGVRREIEETVRATINRKWLIRLKRTFSDGANRGVVRSILDHECRRIVFGAS